MSDDFLKKISNKEKTDSKNPFSQVFQEKREKAGLKPRKEEKEEGGIDGIENLGKTGSPTGDISLESPPPEEEKIPAKEPEKDNILDKEETPESSNLDIPTNDMTKADIFNDNASEEDALVINTSSSYKNLDFGDDNKQNGYSEEIISKVAAYLKENKWQEAIKLIEGNKHE